MCEKTVKKAVDCSEKLVNDYLEKIDKENLISIIADKIKDFYNEHKKDTDPPEDSYQKSYHFLKEYGKNCTGMAQYIILAHAVYGWMPTVLDINFHENIEKAVLELRDGDYKKIEELRTVAKFTNNSFVGASKFLHFIYPDKFAIWDSNILHVLKDFNLKVDGKTCFFSKGSANSMRSFLGYQLAMQKTLGMLKAEDDKIELRDIEKALFYSVSKEQRQKAKDC